MKKVTKKAVKWLVAFVLTLVLTLGIDFALRFTVKPRLSFGFVPSTDESSKTLIVNMTGVLAHAHESAGPLLQEWEKFGDVLLVDYGDGRFDSELVVERTSWVIARDIRSRAINNGEKYQRVVFIGSSMGGRLSVDVVRELHKSFDADISGLQIDLLLLDAPADGSDLVNPFATASKYLYTGPILDHAHLTHFFAGMPKEENIEPGVDRGYLKERVQGARSFDFSFFMDETRYIVKLEPLRANELDGLVDSVTYIRCNRANDVVKPGAADKWVLAFPETKIVELDSTHVGFAERPVTWKNLFHEQLGYLTASAHQ